MSERMVTNYCKECARWARVNEENIKRATAAQEQDAREIARLREAICNWVAICDDMVKGEDPERWGRLLDAEKALFEIAREGE